MFKIILNLLLGMILGRLKTFVLDTISFVDAATLTDEAKRNEAFKLIAIKAKDEGKALRDSLINLVIELAVTYLKK